MPRPIRERDLVLERIKVATDAATRALSTLFAVGAVVVVVVVGGVARVTVRATATATGTATAVITIATVIAIGRATATRTIIVTGVASITVIAIVDPYFFMEKAVVLQSIRWIQVESILISLWGLNRLKN